MSQHCKEQDKIRGKFIRAYYSNSAGGGLYKENLTEAAARAKAAEMRKKGYQFGESELPAKYSCWWGNPAFQHITIEYEAYCKIELTSETAAKLPKNRNRTTIGVGEAVTIRSNIPVLWEIQSNLVNPSSVKSKTPSNEISFSALDKAGSITVRAKTQHDQKSITFSIIEPVSLSYSLARNEDNSPMIFHEKGAYIAIIGLVITVYPKTVNFYKVVFRESNEPSKDSGVFLEKGKIHCHATKETRKAGTKCPRAGTIPVKDKGEEYNILGDYDVVGGGENDPKKITRLPSESSMKTDIDIFWGLEEPLTKKLAKKVNQTVTLYSNGNFLIKKGNYKIEIKKGDNYTKNNNFYK